MAKKNVIWWIIAIAIAVLILNGNFDLFSVTDQSISPVKSVGVGDIKNYVS